MEERFEKVDDSTLKRIYSISKQLETTYDYDFLIRQRQAIQEQKEREMKQRDEELAEVNRLIEEAKKLGIKSSFPPPTK